MVNSAGLCLFDSTDCVTCSDEAVPGRVIQTTGTGSMAIVELDRGVFQEVSLELVEAVPGDLVLVHAKVAIARLGSS
jgi:hydrogenase maturation factor